MNVPISTIVNVQISLLAQSITEAGFGIPLILTDETPVDSWGSERVREYVDLNEVLEDWTSSDDVYRAAQAIFAQTPRVERLKVGLEDTRVAQVQTLVFSGNIITGNTISTFTVSAGGVTSTVTATPFNTSNAQTLADLTAKLQALAQTNATDNGSTTITVTSAVAGVPVVISQPTISGGASQATIAITTTVANHGAADDLSEISEEDDDWYGLIWVERTASLVLQAAAYIETQRKIFNTCSSDSNILSSSSTTDIGALLAASNYTRTNLIFNADPSDFADAAWMGRLFPYDPGSETWAFKTLAGITADVLTSSERQAALDKNVNLYVTIAGTDNTIFGTMASGLYIDLRRGTDWVQARMEERVFAVIKNSLKVPYIRKGIAIVENEIRAVLLNGIRNNFISGEPLDPTNGINEPFTVDFPKLSEISDNDKANRLLPDGTFYAVFTGAIHKVNINGSISV